MPRVSSDTMGAAGWPAQSSPGGAVALTGGLAVAAGRFSGGRNPGAAARVKPTRGNGLESTALGLIWGQGARPASQSTRPPCVRPDRQASRRVRSWRGGLDRKVLAHLELQRGAAAVQRRGLRVFRRRRRDRKCHHRRPGAAARWSGPLRSAVCPRRRPRARRPHARRRRPRLRAADAPTPRRGDYDLASSCASSARTSPTSRASATGGAIAGRGGLRAGDLVLAVRKAQGPPQVLDAFDHVFVLNASSIPALNATPQPRSRSCLRRRTRCSPAPVRKGRRASSTS